MPSDRGPTLVAWEWAEGAGPEVGGRAQGGAVMPPSTGFPGAGKPVGVGTGSHLRDLSPSVAPPWQREPMMAWAGSHSGHPGGVAGGWEARTGRVAAQCGGDQAEPGLPRGDGRGFVGLTGFRKGGTRPPRQPLPLHACLLPAEPGYPGSATHLPRASHCFCFLWVQESLPHAAHAHRARPLCKTVDRPQPFEHTHHLV